jgi:hypothetical protein
MKKIIKFIFILLCSISFGQSKTMDVLFLKNGSIIKGSIIEMNPSSGVKIKTSDGSTFIYKMDEILKTGKEELVGTQTSQETSSVINQSELEKVFKDFLVQKKINELNFIGVSKLNGVKKLIDGQKIYEVEYQLILTTKSDIYINKNESAAITLGTSAGDFLNNFSYSLKQVDGHIAAFGGTLTLIEKNNKIVFEGTIPFEETDNGWRAKNFKNKNYKIVSSDYITPEMEAIQAKEKEKKINELKIKLDWDKQDIKPFVFNKKYFKTINVPFFKNIDFQYTLETNYKERNSVLKEIEDNILLTINKTNRHSEITQETFKNSINKGNLEFLIDEVIFPFTNNGYECKIKLIVKIKGTCKNPVDYLFDNNVPISSSSFSLNSETSKNIAFKLALENLSEKIEEFIFKYEPIALELKRIDLDKNGKANFIVFKKPDLFINAKKIKFLVVNQNEISIKNNSFLISNKVGECFYKGEIKDDEIICEISGAKNKKEVLNIIDKLENFIGISINIE